MRRPRHFALTLTALLALLGSVAASGTTINFSTALAAGNLAQSVSTGGLTVSAWTVNKTTGAWVSTGVILNNRQESPDDRGLGVCLASNCPATGNGDVNEIDNNGSTFDVIRIDLGSVAFLSTIGLSSLDGGAKDGFAIFGSNIALPTLSSLTPIAQGTNLSVGQVNPIININQTNRYFFVTPLGRTVNDSNSDYLFLSANTVPEPYTAATLAIGLLAIGALRLRTTRRRATQSK